MKKLFIIILTGFIIIDIGTACFERPNPDPTIVQINVVNGSAAATGAATVSLYSSMTDLNNGFPSYAQTTDDNNNVSIRVDYQSQYYVVVTRGPAKNYYSGFIPVGVFQSQTDINNSPSQNPAGVVGGIKFKDVNGDGVINNGDKINAPVITLRQSTTNFESITVY